MAYVPIDGVDEQFKLKADIIDKNGYNVPVFEVRVSKDGYFVFGIDRDRKFDISITKIINGKTIVTSIALTSTLYDKIRNYFLGVFSPGETQRYVAQQTPQEPGARSPRMLRP